MESTELEQIRAEFIEKTGLIAQHDGMPRISGRLFGLLVFTGEAISFGALAEQLQVSRGSISSASRLLEDRGLIKRVAKAGDRQDYFQLEDNPYQGMMQHIALGVSRASKEIKATLDALPIEETGPRKRLGAHLRFYATLSETIDRTAQKL